jgi:hypothetical protein
MPEPFLFINAWNEWAEGNHLEPCQKWGEIVILTKRVWRRILIPIEMNNITSIFYSYLQSRTVYSSND